MNRFFAISVLFVFLGVKSYSQEQYSVYFQSDKHLLTGQQAAEFQKWIEENKSSKILSMNGYTDEDGGNQYNDTLAKKRVETIYGLIKNKVKIREDFKRISFGEQHNHSKIKSENRKVIIFYLKEKDLHKEAEILGLKPKEVKKSQPVQFPESIILNNPDGSESEIKLDVVFMKTLNESKTGEKLKLENLNFVLNTFGITKESRGKLYELLLVMQQNPLLKIDIQGHVCCVKSDRQDLSTQRAKAIYKFLEMKGIPKSRMSYRGFGSTQPLHALPEKTEEERAANRRVEIEIVAN
ncbi:OmpA family protein [Flavobacterium sp. H122]|uniref:OmpA family protein n=1 Tax=Flavobacterium sp. H122 TaxID=2529860 RepID=UPI0010A9EC25|nr:OmpA family protein [Flavobacterium sp. H122]